jgi:mono/diheme cytochrome c family protein
MSALVGSPSFTSAQSMGPPAASSFTPPFDLKDPAAVETGRQLFQQTCTGYCHGREGRVSRAPKLRGRQLDSTYLYGRIANGWPPMPAFRTILSPEQIWSLVAYITSLADVRDD